jgi:hypothetical protein
MRRRLRVVMATIFSLAGNAFLAPALANDAFFRAPPLTSPKQAGEFGSALGYCKGQAASIARARQQHPELGPRLDLMENRFAASTGNSCADVEAYMREEITRLGGGPAAWTKWLADWKQPFDAKMAPMLAQFASPDVARSFVDELQTRVDGQLDDAIAEHLISSSRAFRRDPRQQWPTWSRRWVSTGHPKARGMRIRASYPVAFKGTEPGATHMIRKWTLTLPQGGNVMLSVSLFPFDAETTPDDAMHEFETLEPAEIAAGFLEGVDGEVVDARRVRFLGTPGLVMNVRMQLSNIDVEMVMTQRSVIGVVDQGLVIAACGVSVARGDEAILADLTERYLPLCTQYFGSIHKETPTH